MRRAPSVARCGRRLEWRFSVEKEAEAAVAVVPVAAEGVSKSESFRRRGGAGVDVEVVRPWEANKLAAAAEADWRWQPCFSAGSMTRPCSGSR